MSRASFIRSSLWGTTALAITSVLFCSTVGCGQNKADTDNYSNPIITTEVSTSCATSTMMPTTTILTTSSTVTNTEMTTTTAETTSTTQPMTESLTTVVVTEPVYVEPEATTEWIESEPTWTNEEDVILLAKLINHEASATYDGKVMVGSCVVNRMNSKGVSAADVIFESGQFTTAYSLTTYTDIDYQAAQQVLTQGSADTRIFFFNGCHGDGLNWFYDVNYNYLGAW